MKISELVEWIALLVQDSPHHPAGQVPMILGPPGVGKTDLHGQAARMLGWDYLPLFAASYLPEHFGGFPFRDEASNTADFLPLGFLRRIIEATCPILVFLDEIDKCGQQVQNAIAQMIQARKIGQHEVPSCVRFCLAGNRPEDRAGGVKIVTHLVERCVELRLDIDPGGWIEWATTKDIHPIIRAYISRRPEALLDFDPDRVGKQTNPRNYETLSAIMDKRGVAVPLEILRGVLAEKQAVELSQFARLFDELPGYDEIVANPSRAKVSDKVDCQYAIAAMLGEMAQEGHADPVCEYLARLEPEITGLAFTRLPARSVEFARNPAYIKWQLSTGQVFSNR